MPLYSGLYILYQLINSPPYTSLSISLKAACENWSMWISECAHELLNLLCFSQASFVYVIKQWELCFLFSSPKSMMVRFTNYTLVIKRENRILTTVRMHEILIMKFSLHSIYEFSRSMDEKCIGQWVCTVLMYGRAHNFQETVRANIINTGIETHTHSHAFIIN